MYAKGSRPSNHDDALLQSEIGDFIAELRFFGPDRDQHAFSGHVHVACEDRVLFSRGYGYRNVGRELPNSSDTSFRAGSITKQFTATAILLLEERGKLSVSDPTWKHIPEYPAVGADLTIHQLLTHTTGLQDYTEIEEVMQTQDKERTPLELLQTFWDMPLRFTPGAKHEYTNSGYAVLGLIIERASGQSYADFLSEQIFGPAGLLNTTVGDAEEALDRAEGYTLVHGAFSVVEPIAMSVPYAAGAVRSTSRDLAHWHKQLSETAILSDISKAKLYKVEMENYAYGWVVQKQDGFLCASHTSGIRGFLTYYLRDLGRGLTVIVWSNNMAVPSAPIAEFESIVDFAKRAALRALSRRDKRAKNDGA